eukprot:1645504-Prymnesium_polylepis.1
MLAIASPPPTRVSPPVSPPASPPVSLPVSNGVHCNGQKPSNGHPCEHAMPPKLPQMLAIASLPPIRVSPPA